MRNFDEDVTNIVSKELMRLWDDITSLPPEYNPFTVIPVAHSGERLACAAAPTRCREFLVEVFLDLVLPGQKELSVEVFVGEVM